MRKLLIKCGVLKGTKEKPKEELKLLNDVSRVCYKESEVVKYDEKINA